MDTGVTWDRRPFSLDTRNGHSPAHHRKPLGVGRRQGGKEATMEARLALVVWCSHTFSQTLLLMSKGCSAARTIPSPTVQHLLGTCAGSVVSFNLLGLRVLFYCLLDLAFK